MQQIICGNISPMLSHWNVCHESQIWSVVTNLNAPTVVIYLFELRLRQMLASDIQKPVSFRTYLTNERRLMSTRADRLGASET